MLWTNLLLLLFCSVMLGSPFACSPNQPRAQEVAPIRLNVELVALDVEVLKPKTGQILGDLRKEDFLVYEDGVKQEITHFSREEVPLSILRNPSVTCGACKMHPTSFKELEIARIVFAARN